MTRIDAGLVTCGRLEIDGKYCGKMYARFLNRRNKFRVKDCLVCVDFCFCYMMELIILIVAKFRYMHCLKNCTGWRRINYNSALFRLVIVTLLNT